MHRIPSQKGRSILHHPFRVGIWVWGRSQGLRPGLSCLTPSGSFFESLILAPFQEACETMRTQCQLCFETGMEAGYCLNRRLRLVEQGFHSHICVSIINLRGSGRRKEKEDQRRLVAQRIAMDPIICHGKPCIRGMRYPVETILELLSSGMSADEILADFDGLEREDIVAALAFAARLSQVKRLQPASA